MKLKFSLALFSLIYSSTTFAQIVPQKFNTMSSLVLSDAGITTNTKDIAQSKDVNNQFFQPNLMQIITLKLAFSNVYLLKGKTNILIDTGSPKDEKLLLQKLKENEVNPENLGLIIHTHAHFDHCGNTANLLKINPNILTMIHQEDAPYARKGKNFPLKPHGVLGVLAKPFLNQSFEAFEPSSVIGTSISLDAFGIDAHIVHTPGHTSGSVSVIFKDGRAIVGDLLMGSILNAKRATYHFFIHDFEQNNRSIRQVIDFGASQFYVGHGGPLTVESVFLRLNKKCFH
jgi:hydroxyacylglutathione hydrolase